LLNQHSITFARSGFILLYFYIITHFEEACYRIIYLEVAFYTKNNTEIQLIILHLIIHMSLTFALFAPEIYLNLTPASFGQWCTN